MIQENEKKTKETADRLFPNVKFIGETSELQSINKYTREIVIPENVKIAESRIPKNHEQKKILIKELQQAGILSKLNNTVYLIPEQAGYKIRPKDAIVNGQVFEFRTVEGNDDTFQWEFRDAKKKGADTNVYINVLSGISKDEARRRIWLVLRRHPEYTGQIVISFDGNNTYFWDTNGFR